MKLTPENLDDMDCRPLGRDTGIKLSPETEQRMAAFEAARPARQLTALTRPKPFKPPAKG